MVELAESREREPSIEEKGEGGEGSRSTSHFPPPPPPFPIVDRNTPDLPTTVLYVYVLLVVSLCARCGFKGGWRVEVHTTTGRWKKHPQQSSSHPSCLLKYFMPLFDSFFCLLRNSLYKGPHAHPCPPLLLDGFYLSSLLHQSCSEWFARDLFVNEWM